MIVLNIIFVLIASLLKGFLDKSSENRLNGDWWKKGRSWKNKWKVKETEANKDLPRYKKPVLIKDGKKVEIYWGSSRWFVMFTDGWHLIQFIMYRFIDASILLVFVPYLDSLWWLLPLEAGLFVFRGVFFELTHR